MFPVHSRGHVWAFWNNGLNSAATSRFITLNHSLFLCAQRAAGGSAAEQRQIWIRVGQPCVLTGPVLLTVSCKKHEDQSGRSTGTQMSIDSAESQWQLRLSLSRKSVIFTRASLCGVEKEMLGWKTTSSLTCGEKKCYCLLYIISIKLKSLGRAWLFVCSGLKHSCSSCWINRLRLSEQPKTTR